MRSADINAALAALGRQHHGLVRLDHAQDQDISRQVLHHRVRTGVLEAIDENIFRIAGTPCTWEQRALAAVWSQGPDAILSHRAAALLFELDGITQAPLEVLVPRWKRRGRRKGVKVHEARDLVPTDRTTWHGIPCASVVRVLLDLPAVVSARRADQVWEDALRRRLCTVDQLTDRFVQVARRGRPGTRVGRHLLEKRLEGFVPTMSEFERRVRELVVQAGLAPPVSQHPVDIGSTTVFIDLAWPELRIGIECDGRFDHGSNIQLPWDDDRQNELQLRGWFILRFTWETLVNRPEQIIDQLRRAYEHRARLLRATGVTSSTPR